MVGFWEIFRIMIVALFCLTLFDPHRIETIQSEWKPELLFLVDESKSMESLDVKSEQNKLQSRLEFARHIIAHPTATPARDGGRAESARACREAKTDER